MASGNLLGVAPIDARLRRQILLLNNLSRFHKLNVVVQASAEIYLIERELEKVTSGAWFFLPTGRKGGYPWDKAPICGTACACQRNYDDALEYTGFPMGWSFWFTDCLDREAAIEALKTYELNSD